MSISRVGFAELRLCTGYVPMYNEMVKLAKPLISLLIEEYGIKELINRFSNPYWFQSLALAMGFEHNYTGATTVTLKAIKEAINNENLGVKLVGGKGKAATSLPNELDKLVENKEIDESFAHNIKERSRESVKSDNVLLQDSFDIYFHAMIVSEKKYFSIINQGMNEREQLVRRYHWQEFSSLFYENKNTTPVDKKALRLDKKDKSSKEMRKAVFDLVRDYEPEKLERKALLLRKQLQILNKGQKSLFLSGFEKIREVPYYLYFPKNLDMKALEVANNAVNFKELFLTPGLGKSTMRGLAYLSSLIYGSEIVWEEPQKYCYAFGTKAGRPWYVEKEEMRKAALVLSEVIEGGEIEKNRKKQVLRRLAHYVS